jgi:hypothetical protein
LLAAFETQTLPEVSMTIPLAPLIVLSTVVLRSTPADVNALIVELPELATHTVSAPSIAIPVGRSRLGSV